MGLAPVAHVLFNKFMKFNPQNEKWLNRDRFVLSYVELPFTLSGIVVCEGWIKEIDRELENCLAKGRRSSVVEFSVS